MLTVKLHENNKLAIEFEFSDRAIFAECIRRCKDLGANYNAEMKAWVLPARKLRTVEDAFPKASYDYEAFCAYDRIKARDDKFMVESMAENSMRAPQSATEATKPRPAGNSASHAGDTLTTVAFGWGGGYDEWLKAEERKAQMIKNRRYGK